MHANLSIVVYGLNTSAMHEFQLPEIFYTMNVFTAWIIKKYRKVSKTRKPILRIESSIRYGDQGLWETKFSDGALLSVYRNIATCSCLPNWKSSCRHARIMCKLYGARELTDILPSNPYPGIDQKLGVSVLYENDDRQSTSSSTTECPICMEPMLLHTKVIKCPRCSNSVHKSCWLQWERTVYDKKPWEQTLYDKKRKCLICTHIFPDNLMDDHFL